jgi:hypothetical protein
LREACAINSSLSALSSVIMRLTETQRLRREVTAHVPYRDSRLTFLLRVSCSCLLSPARVAKAQLASEWHSANVRLLSPGEARVQHAISHA